jgi:hypothetical protein
LLERAPASDENRGKGNYGKKNTGDADGIALTVSARKRTCGARIVPLPEVLFSSPVVAFER